MAADQALFFEMMGFTVGLFHKIKAWITGLSRICSLHHLKKLFKNTIVRLIYNIVPKELKFTSYNYFLQICRRYATKKFR